MNRTKLYSVLAGSFMALALISLKARAQAVESEWGDLGYTQKSPEVEEIPSSVSDERLTDTPETVMSTAPETVAVNNDDVILPDNKSAASAPEMKTVVKSEDLPPARSTKHFTDVATVQNTYGVMTEENPPTALYVSPFGGTSSVIGNDTADNSPQSAFGANVGLLVSSNMLLELGYTRAVQNFSNPRINTTQGVFVSGNNNVFSLKQNVFDAGVKLFILGRESRLRPFLGGGAGYSRGILNYTPAYQQALGNQAIYSSDFAINQFEGFGELGAEFAFTRNVVATASFRLHGVLSSTTSGDSAPLNYDPSKLDVGNSLSRTASYLISAGLGIYF